MKKIINFTPTGTQPNRSNSLAPLEINEIIEEVIAANELGISFVHIHAREKDTHLNTYKKEVYGRIIEGIRKYCPELLICASLTGRNFPELEKRTEVLQCYPDLGSLTMSSLNFPSGASVNQPETILSLIEQMDKYGVTPEIECFDSGMLNYTHYLIRKNILKAPHLINIILGNLYNSQSDLNSVAMIKSAIPNNAIVCLGGIGDQQLRSNVLGLLDFDGVRVGLEDNLFYKQKEKATNMQLLERVHRLMSELEMKLMTSSELRTKGYGNKIINNR
ncbi:MAG: 3-keto-5-aminohexanoate cleavage protein [Flavobacterium sp.]|nr:3-keto-5-aminohexanoate cleavage protein [Flavobacterium sp.]